jgi:YggT family protein
MGPSGGVSREGAAPAGLAKRGISQCVAFRLAASQRELYTSRSRRAGARQRRRNRAMLEFLGFVSLLLTLYIYILFAAAIMSWLIAFNVVNPRNQFVAMLAEFLYRITEPVLRPIRSFLPSLGGIDISPVIVILIIVFIQSVILTNLAKAFI